MALPATPPQTIGPFFHMALDVPGTECLVPADDPAAVRIQGTLFDGADAPVKDGLIEVWDGRRGQFGRCATDGLGRYQFVVAKPGVSSTRDGLAEAPHLTVLVFARGLLDRLVTRIYFPDEAIANAADPVLSSIAGARDRGTLIARAEPGALRFDIHLQGEQETVFFDLV